MTRPESAASVYATCHGWGKQHQITIAGTFRLHRKGQATCTGAGQLPRERVTPPTSRAQGPNGTVRRPPPGEPADGRSCDGGSCDAPSVGWRWYRDLSEWLPVCGIHMAGHEGPTRIYDTTPEEPAP